MPTLTLQTWHRVFFFPGEAVAALETEPTEPTAAAAAAAIPSNDAASAGGAEQAIDRPCAAAEDDDGDGIAMGDDTGIPEPALAADGAAPAAADDVIAALGTGALGLAARKHLEHRGFVWEAKKPQPAAQRGGGALFFSWSAILESGCGCESVSCV